MHRGEPFHVDFCRFTLPLLYALNETDAAFCVKLRKQLTGLDMTAAEILLYLVDGVVAICFSAKVPCGQAADCIRALHQWKAF